MTKTTNTLKAAIATLDQVALDLETVSREPDSPVDHAIKILRHLSRHAEPHKRDETHGAVLIKSYQDALKEAVAKLEIVLNTDSPSGTLADAIKDIEAAIEYLTGCIGFRTSPSQREPIPSIKLPPSLQGEPADALDKPAIVRIERTSAEVMRLLNAEADHASQVDPAYVDEIQTSKKDASKGESIVQACAQIRGLISDNAHGVWRQHLLDQVSTIEGQAFSKDTPTFALNANGNPLDDEQVELIRCIKATQRELLSLASSTRNYLLAKQKRLKAICDANPCNDIDHELTVEQAVAYGAYRDFTNADGYGWVQRGVSDVQVGVMALVRAVAGPTE